MSNFNTLWIGKNRDRGSILSTKNYQNSDKILRFLKISFYFQNVFGSKYSEENFRKSVQPAAPKYFVWKFLRFSEKICGFKILRFLSENFSELRFILIGLSPATDKPYNLNSGHSLVWWMFCVFSKGCQFGVPSRVLTKRQGLRPFILVEMGLSHNRDSSSLSLEVCVPECHFLGTTYFL